MEHILQATDLVMDYSTQQATPNATHMLALNHVDFDIQAGESIAVMGPSGSCDVTVTMRDGRLSSPQQSQPTAGGAR